MSLNSGWDLVHLEFGSSVNPIPPGGGRLCPPDYCLLSPRFDNLSNDISEKRFTQNLTFLKILEKHEFSPFFLKIAQNFTTLK